MSGHTLALDNWLNDVHTRSGTDLLLTSGLPPMARVDGTYVRLGTEVLTEGDTAELATDLLTGDQRSSLTATGQIDFSFSWRDSVRIRGNAYVQRGATAIALRVIPLEAPTPAELGLPPVVERLAAAPSGLVLVTGPTGAGKSTTLAALIDQVNRHRACHILTIEDPIEYMHTHKQAAVSQREVGVDTPSFADALRAALREDPDVILVGEMRDLESITSTLTLAETGHLVFATLHTNDTAQALDRIIDVFPSDRRDQVQVQLASSLQGVIYQRLVPRVGGGMVAAYEVMVATNAVRSLVREGKTRQLRNVVATHQSEGMQTLESHLATLVDEGVIACEDALAISLYPHEITREVASAGNGHGRPLAGTAAPHPGPA